MRPFTAGIHKQVEYDKQRRRLGGELLDAAGSGMNPLQQRVERKPPSDGIDNFRIEHEALSLEPAQRVDQLRKVAGHGRPALDWSGMILPSRKARQRKPSHFGSYSHSAPGNGVDR